VDVGWDVQVEAGVSVIDGRGKEVMLPSVPARIVSLVPSTTESLFELGCADRVVGVSRFCVHPTEVSEVPRVGGTKDVDIDRVLALEPDVVIGNCEENTREVFDALEAHVPVYAAFPRTVDEAMDDVGALGRLIGAELAAARWRAEADRARADLKQEIAERGFFRYGYLIWRQPWMTISNDTFIASMLREAGGVNVFGEHASRFPVVEGNELGAAGLDLLFLSSEPFPFREEHAAEIAGVSGLLRGQVRFVDGEYCSWHGVRMREAFEYLAGCLRNGWSQVPVR